jgi:hypothetical protein
VRELVGVDDRADAPDLAVDDVERPHAAAPDGLGLAPTTATGLPRSTLFAYGREAQSNAFLSWPGSEPTGGRSKSRADEGTRTPDPLLTMDCKGGLLVGLSPVQSGFLGLWRTLDDRPLGASCPRLAPEIRQKRPQKQLGHLWSVRVKLYYVGPRERLGSEAAPT